MGLGVGLDRLAAASACRAAALKDSPAFSAMSADALSNQARRTRVSRVLLLTRVRLAWLGRASADMALNAGLSFKAAARHAEAAASLTLTQP